MLGAWIMREISSPMNLRLEALFIWKASKPLGCTIIDAETKQWLFFYEFDDLHMYPYNSQEHMFFAQCFLEIILCSINQHLKSFESFGIIDSSESSTMSVLMSMQHADTSLGEFITMDWGTGWDTGQKAQLSLELAIANKDLLQTITDSELWP